MPEPAAYGPCSITATIVDNVRTIQPVQIARRVERAAIEPPAMSRRNTTPPIRRASPAKTPARATPNSVPTVTLLLAVVSVAQPFTLGAGVGPRRSGGRDQGDRYQRRHDAEPRQASCSHLRVTLRRASPAARCGSASCTTRARRNVLP